MQDHWTPGSMIHVGGSAPSCRRSSPNSLYGSKLRALEAEMAKIPEQLCPSPEPSAMPSEAGAPATCHRQSHHALAGSPQQRLDGYSTAQSGDCQHPELPEPLQRGGLGPKLMPDSAAVAAARAKRQTAQGLCLPPGRPQRFCPKLKHDPGLIFFAFQTTLFQTCFEPVTTTTAFWLL